MFKELGVIPYIYTEEYKTRALFLKDQGIKRPGHPKSQKGYTEMH